MGKQRSRGWIAVQARVRGAREYQPGDIRGDQRQPLGDPGMQVDLDWTLGMLTETCVDLAERRDAAVRGLEYTVFPAHRGIEIAHSLQQLLCPLAVAFG